MQKVERDTEFLKKNVPSGGGLHPTEGFLLV
ncbi:putative peptide maturation dehydrogenase, partial [Stenotrophomonas maltophilia]